MNTDIKTISIFSLKSWRSARHDSHSHEARAVADADDALDVLIECAEATLLRDESRRRYEEVSNSAASTADERVAAGIDERNAHQRYLAAFAKVTP